MYFLECGCSSVGTVEYSTCDSEGICDCKVGYAGDKCDQCAPGYYSEDGKTCQGKLLHKWSIGVQRLNG